VFLLALISLGLFAVGVILITRPVETARTRTAENLGQIDSYGFENTTTEIGDGNSRLRARVDGVATTIGDYAAMRLGQIDSSELRNLLRSAGIYGISPQKFTGYRILGGLTAGALWLWIGFTFGYSSFLVIFLLPGFTVLGWYLPLYLVKKRSQRRLAQIDYELPELIDLLIVTVEAGLGFSASVQIASDRLGGPLGQELRLALQEQSMGLSTNDALRNMLARADTPAMRSFVRSMLQGETLGVSIGQIMRNLAQEMRKRRRATAEERAQKAPIKILFPLIFLIFPAMFVILLGPAVYSFIQAFKGV
jgi:tight adherence protein C